MKTLKDIPYARGQGERGLADLYLPDKASHARAALVIHGGGWRSLDKGRMTDVGRLLAENGWAAFLPNYRLIGDAPWPACRDDCMVAARFLMDRKHEAMRDLDTDRILVMGASAGGHLAMITGLTLPPENVAAIVSIAGPADLSRRLNDKKKMDWMAEIAPEFFGTNDVTGDMLTTACPVEFVRPESPRLLCVHSVNDQLVHIKHSRWMLARYDDVGAHADLFEFAGAGDSHGIWETKAQERRLIPALRREIMKLLQEISRTSTDSHSGQAGSWREPDFPKGLSKGKQAPQTTP